MKHKKRFERQNLCIEKCESGNYWWLRLATITLRRKMDGKTIRVKELCLNQIFKFEFQEGRVKRKLQIDFVVLALGQTQRCESLNLVDLRVIHTCTGVKHEAVVVE